MQESFAFAAADIADWHARLIVAAGDPLPIVRRAPLHQLVKSMLGARTRDAVSAAADAALTAHYRPLIAIADAAPAAIEAAIAAVTFAPDKARHLVKAMAIVRAVRPDGDLGFLGGLPIADALAWLERLPGVGRKVAAATLNASTLARPVFIVDNAHPARACPAGPGRCTCRLSRRQRGGDGGDARLGWRRFPAIPPADQAAWAGCVPMGYPRLPALPVAIVLLRCSP